MRTRAGRAFQLLSRFTILMLIAAVGVGCGEDGAEDDGAEDEECSIDARCPGEGKQCATDGPEDESCRAEAEADGLALECEEQNSAIWCPAQ